MKKLSKDDQKQLTTFVVNLELANKAISDAVETLKEKVTAYNEILAEAREFRDDKVGQMEDYYGDRSEKWQEGDAGEAYNGWKDEWEGLDLEDIEDPDEYNDLAHRDLLENAPPEPNQ